MRWHGERTLVFIGMIITALGLASATGDTVAAVLGKPLENSGLAAAGVIAIGMATIILGVKRSKETLDEKIRPIAPAAPAIKYVVLDTGAIIEMYHQLSKYYGTENFCKGIREHDSGVSYIITQQVYEELKRQKSTKQKGDDHRPLVPAELLVAIETLIAEEKLVFIDAQPGTEQHAKTQAGVANHPGNYKRNTRIGSGDHSIVTFAETFKDDGVLVVSPDSDIPLALSGAGCDNVKYLTTGAFLKQYSHAKQSYHEIRRP